jgi:hypothetical protein
MTKKIKEPKIILEYYTDNLYEYHCPTCLHNVANKDQVCKYCNEELKEKK